MKTMKFGRLRLPLYDPEDSAKERFGVSQYYGTFVLPNGYGVVVNYWPRKFNDEGKALVTLQTPDATGSLCDNATLMQEMTGAAAPLQEMENVRPEELEKILKDLATREKHPHWTEQAQAACAAKPIDPASWEGPANTFVSSPLESPLDVRLAVPNRYAGGEPGLMRALAKSFKPVPWEDVPSTGNLVLQKTTEGGAPLHRLNRGPVWGTEMPGFPSFLAGGTENYFSGASQKPTVVVDFGALLEKIARSAHFHDLPHSPSQAPSITGVKTLSYNPAFRLRLGQMIRKPDFIADDPAYQTTVKDMTAAIGKDTQIASQNMDFILDLTARHGADQTTTDLFHTAIQAAPEAINPSKVSGWLKDIAQADETERTFAPKRIIAMTSALLPLRPDMAADLVDDLKSVAKRFSEDPVAQALYATAKTQAPGRKGAVARILDTLRSRRAPRDDHDKV